MPTFEPIKDVINVGGNEFVDASLPAKAMLGATACGLAFEWGTGNEALLGMVGGQIYKHGHSTLVTALATGGVSFVEQSLLGAATAISIHNFPKIMEAARTKMEERHQRKAAAKQSEAAITQPVVQEDVQETTAPTEAGISHRFIYAFTLGTSVVELIDNSKEKRTTRRNLQHAVGDAALIGGGVVGIAATAAAATNFGRSLGLEQQADMFVNIITNPLTYISLFGLKVGNDFRRNKVSKSDKSNMQQGAGNE